ncbi:MAG: hypothetical protein AAGU74_10365 [Bacillota bacterium]
MTKGKKRTSYSTKEYYDLLSYENAEPIVSDVLGSYTGISKDGSAPVQDADDL